MITVSSNPQPGGGGGEVGHGAPPPPPMSSTPPDSLSWDRRLIKLRCGCGRAGPDREAGSGDPGNSLRALLSGRRPLPASPSGLALAIIWGPPPSARRPGPRDWPGSNTHLPFRLITKTHRLRTSNLNITFWVAVISVKNHKRLRRNRQSVTAKTRKDANAKVCSRYTNLTYMIICQLIIRRLRYALSNVEIK